jgi:hypothetical protein
VAQDALRASQSILREFNDKQQHSLVAAVQALFRSILGITKLPKLGQRLDLLAEYVGQFVRVHVHDPP